MIELTSAKRPDGPREDLFSLDGTVYTIETEPKPSTGLRFLVECKTIGEAKAVVNLFEAVIGLDGLTALSQAETMTPEQYQSLQEIIIGHALGSAALGKG